MTEPSRADVDRVVSRRVDNPTEATESDERAYSAAQTDGSEAANQTGSGDTATERAEHSLAADDESEPGRTE